MPTLQVREVPAEVYGALVEASVKERRSLAQQALVTLERGLGLAESGKARRRRVLAAIAATPKPDVDLPDAATLVREDRHR